MRGNFSVKIHPLSLISFLMGSNQKEFMEETFFEMFLEKLFCCAMKGLRTNNNDSESISRDVPDRVKDESVGNSTINYLLQDPSLVSK